MVNGTKEIIIGELDCTNYKCEDRFYIEKGNDEIYLTFQELKELEQQIHNFIEEKKK